jgi:transcriptional regulator with XRE-family HTH domain
MHEQNINLSTLAERAHIAVGTIQKLMNDPTCNPTIASLEAICTVLNTTVSYLIGQDEKFFSYEITKVPVLAWEKIKENLLNFIGMGQTKFESNEMIATSLPLTAASFALKMQGNSMLPIFPEGTMLIFDPKKNPYENCYVLVYIKEHKKIVFKELLIDEPFMYLKSVNPDFKNQLLLLNDDDKILATLIQAQMSY